MATQGTATLDFGTGASDAKVTVTGQTGITGTMLVEAWLSGAATSNNLADAGFVELMHIYAADIIAGTGFTIYGVVPFGRAFGQYTVNWVYN